MSVQECKKVQLIIIGLAFIYLAFAWRFWFGFERTHFSQRFLNRLKFSILWPVFYLTNNSFRRNFKRALKR
ncbi:MAG: hypothetical protein O1I87_11060 [Cylindrospermopsis raciborskii PAMP2012]|uniref:Uncharacterized protein n=1 Tax=Cylindrospermopsis raciborskii CENA302 TaxID=1170768 RepID=A0A9Q5QUW8_9CYAN|nr:hypothetical protein [Cylindrospermopsis raciborskii]MCZ2202465.1 hypothetical protein [Cylindrospermopsis raciborskii PAMP2012]MCZ2206013.1 hypothetical protein [Cylindrospermopsis raciborskii PAMP2011]OPH08827.1 hypothetical protein CENA302_15005 [Cylindrospermopsis raciborskii CENA302]NLQ05454.1 hypothetical protein [Cylindrospermopsis raciborskii MVCC19]OHY32258.1 hypothetical protein BCV64_12335 [Cylindrospermopsis raciborskii MVCC14]